MAFGSILFTTKGKMLQAKAQAGTKLTFTKLALGDGELNGQSILELNQLKNLKLEVPISRLKVLNGGIASVGGTFTNESINTGFYWRELGLFASDPDLGEILYCYGNAGVLAEYIPASGGNAILEKRIDIETLVGDAKNISAIINSSLVYATIEDVEGHNEDPLAHPSITKQIDLNTASIVEHSNQIKNLSDQLGNIDMSWDSVTGKPPTFPPSTHKHTKSDITGFPTSLPANGGNADTIGGRRFEWQGQSGQPQWVWGANEPGNTCYVWNPSTFNVNSATYVQGRNLVAEFEDLKSSVVNGKQAVVNALNGKYGYDTGLTTNNAHNDYAWWIGQLPTVSKIGKPASGSLVLARIPALGNVKTIAGQRTITHNSILFAVSQAVSGGLGAGWTISGTHGFYFVSIGTAGKYVPAGETSVQVGMPEFNSGAITILNPEKGTITLTLTVGSADASVNIYEVIV